MSDSKDRPNRVLRGQVNWLRWLPGFKADARADDTWTLFDGTEALLTKPVRANYLANLGEPEPGSDGKVSGVEIQRREFAYNKKMDEYKLDTTDYEKQRERVRRANKMLATRIDESMQGDVEDKQNPREALEHLKSLYKMQDSRAMQMIHDQLDKLALVDCADMATYINQKRQFRADLKALDEQMSDASLINKIIKGLPESYDQWIEYYNNIQGDPNATTPTLQSIEMQLLTKEATLPKPSKKGKGRENKSKGKSDPSKNADGTIRDKCTYCDKWGHKEDTCWQKDPSKKPEKKEVKSGESTKAASGAKTTLPHHGKPTGHSAMALLDEADDVEQEIADAEEGWTTVRKNKGKAKDTKDALLASPGTPTTPTRYGKHLDQAYRTPEQNAYKVPKGLWGKFKTVTFKNKVTTYSPAAAESPDYSKTNAGHTPAAVKTKKKTRDLRTALTVGRMTNTTHCDVCGNDGGHTTQEHAFATEYLNATSPSHNNVNSNNTKCN